MAMHVGVSPAIPGTTGVKLNDGASGEGLCGRKLNTMDAWARNALSQFSDTEIGALYSYLHGLP